MKTYRPVYCPSTFDTSPSPDTTATRSFPLNHLTECRSPQDVMSIGHVNTTDSPRNFDTVSSGMRQKNNNTFII